MYEYENIELTPTVFKELLIELFDGKQFKRADAVKVIMEFHEQNGGKLEKNEYIGTFKKASKMLKESGLVNRGYGVWQLNYEKPETELFEIKEPEIKICADEEYGDGEVAVYVYYYDAYKKLSELDGSKLYPCKIGRTDRAHYKELLVKAALVIPKDHTLH